MVEEMRLLRCSETLAVGLAKEMERVFKGREKQNTDTGQGRTDTWSSFGYELVAVSLGGYLYA